MPLTTVTRDALVRAAGTKLEPGDWLDVSQERINAFADCTEDHQFIHVDEEAAQQTPFGGTIAHGFLTLSLLSKMVADNGLVPENLVMGINYGFDKVRFLAPVRSGRRIRGHTEIVSVDPRGGNRLLLKQRISVEIEGEDTPALVAEWLTMWVTG